MKSKKYLFFWICFLFIISKSLQAHEAFSFDSHVEITEKNESILELEIQNIQTLTRAIHDCDLNNPLLQLALYAERGIKYFLLENYQLAIEDFEYILNRLCEGKISEHALFGTALWGRLFCHAYLGQDEIALDDLVLFNDYFRKKYLSCECCFNDPRYSSAIANYFCAQTVVQFANPDQKISAQECRDRVEGTAALMRILAMKIPNPNLAN